MTLMTVCSIDPASLYVIATLPVTDVLACNTQCKVALLLDTMVCWDSVNLVCNMGEGFVIRQAFCMSMQASRVYLLVLE